MRHLGAVATVCAVVSCSRGDSMQSAPGSAAQATVAAQGRETNAVPLATRPSSACDWIPADTAEAIIGRFAAPPRASHDGCLYTLVIPASVLDSRAKMQRVRAAIKAPPIEYPPYALLLEVQVGVAAGERGMRLAAEKLSEALRDDSDSADRTTSKSASKSAERSELAGWDAGGMQIGGRLGTIAVWVSSDARDLDVPPAKQSELAARVRDRIPDLPFPMNADYSAGDSRDPCTLLTPADAESVLGKLVVPPYRTANGGPLAYSKGTSCAYYTPRHHALIVTPHWSNAKTELRATDGINNLIARVVNDSEAASADTIEGPWDELAVEPDGRLELRRGDRSLEIAYETSSTDKAGALRLAKIALGRLTSAP